MKQGSKKGIAGTREKKGPSAVLHLKRSMRERPEK